jgi:alkylation response protein AidB-like acyl-CoA dehydrogenase
LVDFLLSDEVETVRKHVAGFARDCLAPAERAIDRIPVPEDAYRGEEMQQALKAAYEFGLHKLYLPKEVGGIGAPQGASPIVMEELAAAGAGLASHFLVAPIVAGLIASGGLGARHSFYREYLEAYVEDKEGKHSSAWAITEPNVGSDLFDFKRPEAHLETKATPDGEGFILNGAKSAFVSNGWLSDALLLMVSMEPDKGMHGTGVFVIPGDLPGMSRGRPLDKVGLRALNQAEIFFDDVFVPQDFLLMPPGGAYQHMLERIVTGGNTSVGLLALGVARAAYEHGLAYAKQRRQGGKTIFEHQLVADKLFKAFRTVEASRALLWKSNWLISNGRPSLPTAMAARTLASDGCMEVTREMVQVMGGYGISRESPVEKYYRDAKLLQIMDGTNEAVSMTAAAKL